VRLDAADGGERGFESAVGGFGGFAIELLLKFVDLFVGEDAFAEQAHLELGERVTEGVGIALGGGAVELVVV
jgi:hypothetical protein